jgi:hypothetical protein
LAVSLPLNGVEVIATPARHGPPLSLPLVGPVIGFILKWPSQKDGVVYITGDTVFFSGVEEVGRRYGIGTAFVHAGTLDPAALTELQGGWPWQFLAFESPMLLFACIVLLGTGLPESSRRGYRVASLDAPEDSGPLGHRVSRSLCFFAEMLHLFVTSGIGVVVFLGGWSHGVDASSGSLGLLLGAAVLQLKTWAVVFCLLGVRWAMSHVARSDLFGFWLRWLFPLSIAGSLLSLAYQRGIVRYAFLEQARHGVSLVVFLLVAALSLYFAARIVRAIRSGTRATQFTLNPWL